MPLDLNSADADFDARLAGLLGARQGSDSSAAEAARTIIADVRARGDAAVIELTNRFDRLSIADADGLWLDAGRIKAAAAKCPEHVRDALKFAAERIRVFHEYQTPAGLELEQPGGMMLGYRFTPISAVGLYVPGGTAAYPSSLLMNTIPAQVAGVERIVVMVPTPDDVLSPALAAAIELLGLTEVYRVGGAQAVAAFAYGTESIKPVDLVVGPGNAYVAAAKREVYGIVGIDSLAGPSEILVIADDSADPDWIAADLLSQAEHDPVAQSILITDDAGFADRVQQAIDAHLETLPRAEIAGASWRDFGAIVLVENLSQAPALVDRIAPEHLELAVDDPDALAEDIHHAGAIFLGRYTPEAIGDYVAGPNHVLPTARSARFSSGLGVLDFIKRSSLIKCTPESLAKIGPAAIALAESEGLQAHGLSVAIRSNQM